MARPGQKRKRDPNFGQAQQRSSTSSWTAGKSNSSSAPPLPQTTASFRADADEEAIYDEEAFWSEEVPPNSADLSHTAPGNRNDDGNGGDQYDENEEEADDSPDDDDDDVDVDPRSKDKEKKGKKGTGAQVLPVADLPDDWEGEVEDGATYLALAMRADKALPTFTRVENPWSQPSAPEPPKTASTSSSSGPASAEAGPSRHPALPKEAWQTVFPLNFVQYKKTIAATWPPSPAIPYPVSWPKIPPTSQRAEWGYFINGHPRKRVYQGRPAPVNGKGKAKAVEVEVDEEEGMNGGMDEEEALNAGLGGVAEADDEDDMDMDLEEEEEEVLSLPGHVLEPLAEKHNRRDPHVCILQKLDTFQIIALLRTLMVHIQNTLTPLETDLIPPSYDPLSATSTARPHSRKNPFSEHYSRWIFALLLVLDPFLSASQVSVLRELARVIMRVGGWRWVEAVMTGEVGLPAGRTGLGEGEGEGEAPTPWVLGARWKYGRDSREASGVTELEMSRPAKEQISPTKREEYDETGVDETLARCWLIVHAIAAGWGQRDLVMDLEDMFS